ncbi:unnamed protein product, partial [Didymodactylos carnosus]
GNRLTNNKNRDGITRYVDKPNYSYRALAAAEESLLAKGWKYAINLNRVNMLNVKIDIEYMYHFMNKNSLIKYFQEVNKYAKEYADLTSKITTMSNQDDIIITDAQQTKSRSQQSSKMLTASLEIARKFLENLNSTTQ